MKAFSEISAISKTSNALDSAMKEHIGDFMPRLLEHATNELFRSQIGDIITLVEGYDALWDVQAISKDEYSKVHVHC